MERTLIAFNLPNTVTVGLMALILWGFVAVVCQFVLRRGGAVGGGTY